MSASATPSAQGASFSRSAAGIGGCAQPSTSQTARRGAPTVGYRLFMPFFPHLGKRAPAETASSHGSALGQKACVDLNIGDGAANGNVSRNQRVSATDFLFPGPFCQPL